MIDPLAVEPASDKERPPSAASDEDLYATLKEWISTDIEKSQSWRGRARSNFQFLAGIGDKQWDEDALKLLRDEGRPVITFNRTLKYVMAIRGLEINNRHETIYLPRDVTAAGKVAANELLTQTSEWMDDQCNAARHKSRAFRDMLATGIGITESVMDYDDDPRGRYVRVRVNPLEIGWDANARDQNYLDKKRIWRVREMLASEARELLAGMEGVQADRFSDAELHASWAADVTSAVNAEKVKTLEEKERRDEARVAHDPKRKVIIVQVQWWEYEGYHRVAMVDPATGVSKTMDVSPEQLQVVQARAQQLGVQVTPTRMLRRRRFKQAFLGSRILAMGPAPRPDGFSFNCMTYEIDDGDGMPFGFVDLMRDVQTWSNKLFSQVLHITNSTAKGGILAETDAFDDIKEAQKTYAKPNAITEVAPGALSKGKIMAKPGVGIPTAVIQMLQFAVQSFSDVSGVNLELLGLADRDQPGVLEAQRKQAAMTILATAFDSIALYEQEEGRIKLHYIQNYIARTDRMIRIAGEDGYQVIPLIRDKTLGEYDVVVEDAPSAPNTKEKVWQVLGMLVPPLERQGLMTPETVAAMLDYVPYLPSKLVQLLKKIAMRPDPDAQLKRQAAITSAIEDLRGKKAAREKDEAAASAQRAAAVLNLAKAGASQAQVALDQWNAVLAASGLKGAMTDLQEDEPPQGQVGPVPSVPPLGGQSPGPAPEPDMSGMPPGAVPGLGEMPHGMPAMPGGLVPPGGLRQ